MLSIQEKAEIDNELGHCLDKKSGSIEALKTIQKSRRWISDETLKDVADYLKMTPAELDNIATFYNLIFRKPVGRHVILVCDSVVCWVMGGDSITDYICRKLGIALGETTADNRFTLVPISCLGACDRAPAMMIDDVLFADLTNEKINVILDKYK